MTYKHKKRVTATGGQGQFRLWYIPMREETYHETNPIIVLVSTGQTPERASCRTIYNIAVQTFYLIDKTTNLKLNNSYPNHYTNHITHHVGNVNHVEVELPE